MEMCENVLTRAAPRTASCFWRRRWRAAPGTQTTAAASLRAGNAPSSPGRTRPPRTPRRAPAIPAILGETMRDAARNKERWKGRRTPTQGPSTDLAAQSRTRPPPHSDDGTTHWSGKMRAHRADGRDQSTASLPPSPLHCTQRRRQPRAHGPFPQRSGLLVAEVFTVLDARLCNSGSRPRVSGCGHTGITDRYRPSAVPGSGPGSTFGAAKRLHGAGGAVRAPRSSTGGRRPSRRRCAGVRAAAQPRALRRQGQRVSSSAQHPPTKNKTKVRWSQRLY